MLALLVALAATTVSAPVATAIDLPTTAPIWTLPIIPERVVRERRRLLQGDEETPAAEEGHASQVDALYQGYGTHYVDLWCGKPPQRQTLIINTGGPGTAFPCSNCHDCGKGNHVDNYFQEENSMSFSTVSCDQCFLGDPSTDDPSKQCDCVFGVSYMEGSSWVAKESKDHCYIGGLHNKPISTDDGGRDDLDPEHAPAFGFELMFGCQTTVTGLFVGQLADGILGMDNSPKSFWHQMFEAQKMEEDKFSLCFSRQGDKTTESGAMTFGGTDDRFHLHPMVFSIHKDWGRDFGVLVRRVYLRKGGGGDSVASSDPKLPVQRLDIEDRVLNAGPVIIESGTTDTYFTSKLFGPFQEVYKNLTGHEYNHNSQYISFEDVQKLPTILIQIHGDETLNKELGDDPSTVVGLVGDLDPDHPYDVLLAIPPSHYMEEVGGSYAARFYMTEGPREGSLLGANSIMGHDVLFDARNGKIGWAESNCDYTHLLEEEGFDAADKPVAPAAAPVQPPPTTNGESSNYVPANDGKDASGGTCGFGCQTMWFLVLGSVAAAMIIRQGNFGALTQRVRRITGGSTYQPMSMNEFRTSHGLELHEASRFS